MERSKSPQQMPFVDFSPADLIRHQAAQWRGVQVETIQAVSHEPFEYSFKERCHLLVAIEQGARHDGELLVEGLPTSTARSCSHKLIFVPATRRFFGWQKPRELTRSVCIYVDPQSVASDPDLDFVEGELNPRLLFEDNAIWQTMLKLKAQIGSTDPRDHLYAETLGTLLLYELMRLDRAAPGSKPAIRGGLAAWQEKRVKEFMEEHLTEEIFLNTLAELVRLSQYHFLRSFKRSFGEPPHQYWTRRRMERAKALLADPHASITEIAFAVGYRTTSAFSMAFRRVTGRRPTDYRRELI